MSKEKAKALRSQGKSIREIATELKVSKSTVHRWSKAPTNSPDPLNQVSYRLPPGQGQFTLNSVQQYTGIYRAGQSFYLPADLALRENRHNARAMWNNLVIREALQARSWAVAEQAGHVEPQDKTDTRQVQIASKIQEVIDDIPDFLKLKYCLLKSRFFGAYGVQLAYQWRNNGLRVKAWEPVHGDSIIFKQDSNAIGIYTTIGGGPGVKKVTTEAGYIGRAHVLEDGREVYLDPQGRPYQQLDGTERQAFILMTYDPDPSDFLDSRGAGGVKGLGIRSTIYPSWLCMQEVLGNLMDWLERVGSGITMFKFLRGNQASYDSAVELAQSMSNQAVVMVPVEQDVNSGKPIEGVERIEVPSTGLDNMLRVLDEYFGAQIRRFIVGQDATSQPMKTGLGSKISETQENTFARIVRFDAADLAETLTHQLVAVIQEWNHPDAFDFKCKYVIDTERPDVAAQMDAVVKAAGIGVTFDEDEVRSLCGMSRPSLDSVLVGGKDPAPIMMPPNSGANPLNKEKENDAKEDVGKTEDAEGNGVLADTQKEQ